jgi:hypothetical protein
MVLMTDTECTRYSMLILPLAALLMLGIGITAYARRLKPVGPLLPELGQMPTKHQFDDLETIDIV